jgi:hypothetical protein
MSSQQSTVKKGIKNQQPTLQQQTAQPPLVQQPQNPVASSSGSNVPIYQPVLGNTDVLNYLLEGIRQQNLNNQTLLVPTTNDSSEVNFRMKELRDYNQIMNYLTSSDLVDAAIDSEYGYNGLNPEVILAVFYKRGAELGKKYNEISTDLKTFLDVKNMRTTNFERTDFVEKTLNQEKALALKRRAAEYKIQKSAKMIRSNNSTLIKLTLNRLAAAVPHLDFISRLKIGKLIGDNGSLPFEFAFPNAPCLMTDQEWSKLGSEWYKWSFRFQEIINKKGRVDNAEQSPIETNFDLFMSKQMAIVEAMRTHYWTKQNFLSWRVAIKMKTKSTDTLNNIPVHLVKWSDSNMGSFKKLDDMTYFNDNLKLSETVKVSGTQEEYNSWLNGEGEEEEVSESEEEEEDDNLATSSSGNV